jgi:di/tricarboxylate transporter
MTIVGLVRFQSRPEKVFGVLLLVLYIGNFVSTQQLIGSFANQGLLTLILLMVCSLALEKTRLLQIIAKTVINPSYSQTWLRLYTFTTISSGFLNNTAVVSTMLAPIRNNPHHPASKLLLPLSYAAILGGTLTLVGTSTNLIVNSMVLEADLPALGFFDFTLIGSFVVVGCGVILYFVSRWLPTNTDTHTDVASYFIDTEVQKDSALVGKSIEQNGLRHLDSLFLVEIMREGRLISPVAPQEIIKVSDRLFFSGDIKKVTELKQFDGLTLFADESGLPIANLTEVVIRPESILSGRTLKRAGFRALFDSAVVAIKRDGEAISGKLGDVILRPGDFLVLAVGKDFKNRHNIRKNFYFISDYETEHKLSGVKEWLAIGGFFTSIGLAAIGWIPLFQSMFVLLGLLLLTGCLQANEVLQRLPRQIWIIISAALLLSQALVNADALVFIEHFVDQHQQSFTPLMGLVLVYLLTWLLTELVTNNAAAALMFPIAFSLAVSLDANMQSFILALAFGASASFISPYGYQTNLMVYNAGQYRLMDFVRVGLPVAIAYGVIAVSGIAFFYL